MINFINYLLVFIIIVFFAKINFFSIGYIALNICLIISWMLVFIKNKKIKGKVEKKGFDKNILFLIMMIISANLIIEFHYVNLIFGFIYYVDFLIEFIRCIKKQDYAMNGLNVNSNRLFDIFTLICLGELLFNLLANQI